MKIDRGKIHEAPQMAAQTQRESAAQAQKPSRLSYSYSHRDKTPGSQPQMYSVRPNVAMAFQRNRDPLIAAQIDAGKKSELERRGSHMIAQQKPAPKLKPSPQLSHGADRAAFYAGMSLDHLQAKKTQRELGRRKAKEQYILERQMAVKQTSKRQFNLARGR